MTDDGGDAGRFVVEEDPPATLSRRAFIKAGAAVAGIAWIGAFGGSVLRSITSGGGTDASGTSKTFQYYVPEGESPWYSDMDGKEVMADDFPVDQSAKVLVSGMKGVLMRVDPDRLVDRVGTDLGFVAYSSTCTHLGCQVYFARGTTPVGDFPKGVLYCPCHQGAFDVYRGAEVLYGPPPRPLPKIPLRVTEGRVEAV